MLSKFMEEPLLILFCTRRVSKTIASVQMTIAIVKRTNAGASYNLIAHVLKRTAFAVSGIAQSVKQFHL